MFITPCAFLPSSIQLKKQSDYTQSNMSISGGNPLTILANIDKFDSTNWATWNNNIKNLAELRGVWKYIDGTIINPASTTTTTTIAQPTAASTIAMSTVPLV